MTKKLPKKEMTHKTIGGWCCACEYDITKMANEIKRMIHAKDRRHKKTIDQIEHDNEILVDTILTDKNREIKKLVAIIKRLK